MTLDLEYSTLKRIAAYPNVLDYDDTSAFDSASCKLANLPGKCNSVACARFVPMSFACLVRMSWNRYLRRKFLSVLCYGDVVVTRCPCQAYQVLAHGRDTKVVLGFDAESLQKSCAVM